MNSKIYTNMDSIHNINIFNKNQAAASKAMRQATTGMKIASVADNPTGWATSEGMRERINSLKQASQNIQNGSAMANTAAEGVANTMSVLATLKERVLFASSDTANDTDRANAVKEINALLAQINDNSKNMQYNGKNLLDGSKNGEAAEGGGGGGGGGGDVAVAGNADANIEPASYYIQVGDAPGMTVELKVGKLNTESLGLDDESLFTAEALGTAASAETAAKAIDDAIAATLGLATDIGSVQQRLGYTADNVSTQIENMYASDSAIRDADMAQSISDYLRSNVLAQASQYMLAQSNQNAYSVLNLLLQ